MTRPMRRLAALLPVVVLLALAVTPASAQSPSPFPSPTTGDVRLQLVEQTAWNGPESPTLELRFRATNQGTAPLGELTIGVTLFGRVLSRTAYERSLLADPVPAVVVEAETYAREGPLEPGASRVFELALALDAPGIDTTSSGIYPLKVDLRIDGAPVAAIRTSAIYLVRQPEQPLSMSWTFVLHHPVVFRPDGVFTSTALEDALEPSGRIGGLTKALAELARTSATPVDVAVSPVLLLQLTRMRDGYTRDVAGEIREVRPEEGGSHRRGRCPRCAPRRGSVPAGRPVRAPVRRTRDPVAHLGGSCPRPGRATRPRTGARELGAQDHT